MVVHAIVIVIIVLYQHYYHDNCHNRHRIFVIEIIDVSIIADVTVYLGKKQNKTKQNKNKESKTGKKTHTHMYLYQPRVLEGLCCHTFSDWK